MAVVAGEREVDDGQVGLAGLVERQDLAPAFLTQVVFQRAGDDAGLTARTRRRVEQESYSAQDTVPLGGFRGEDMVSTSTKLS